MNQIPKVVFPEMDPAFQQHYSQLIDQINSLAGYNGEIEFQNHVNLKGSRIKNVGQPVSATDAISNDVADKRYSAESLRTKLEAGGSNALTSVRRLNDPKQRERSSSYMNDLMSSVPSANSIYPTLANVSGGVQVTIPSSKYTFADGSSTILAPRTDLLSFPSTYGISSISCVGNLVTVVTTTPPSLVAGQAATITGVTPDSFNGSYPLTSVSGSTLTYQLSLGTLAGSGGSVEVHGVWYYAAQKRSNRVFLLGPYTSDTMQNRLQANYDGVQIVAVVVITSSGGQRALSGGGGSAMVGSPTAGSFF